MLINMNTWTVLKSLVKKNYLIKKCFYSSVKDGRTDNNGEKLDGHISNEKYLTCNKILNEFNMKNISDYPEHYLKKDVLLLADVFEKVIDTYFRSIKLDPCHHFSSTGLSWDAMLKINGVELEKVSDIDMYLFIEKELRRGIFYIVKRYS